MGTNYYLHENVCSHCQRGDERLHIGKSSAGWVFALHVIPEEGLDSLDDWLKRWDRPDSVIRDEYGRKVTPTEMLREITERSHSGTFPNVMYASREEFHQYNHSEDGPNGLMRPRIDPRHCIAHGEGTWSYNIGEFS